MVMPLKILATTSSFIRAVDLYSLKDEISGKNFSVILADTLKQPFSFDPNEVVAIAAGEPKLGAEELKYFPNLKIIARFGRGLDNIDVAYAKDRGIAVTSVPQGSNTAVAELTIGFIFSLARRIPEFNAEIKQETWRRDYGVGVVGKTLGLVGFGAIGKEVAAMARGVGMIVSAFDPSVAPDEFAKRGVLQSDFQTILRESDFVSLHVPLAESTRNLINYAAISAMKKDVFLINTSRGGIVDENALYDALMDGRIAGAALDVFVAEPPFVEDGVSKQLALHPKVIATPHTASFTFAAHEAVARAVLKNIFAVHEGKPDALEGKV